jgi:HEAT repeat protein
MNRKTGRREGLGRTASSRLPVFLFLLLSFSGAPRSAQALVWPDVAERVERDLLAADPATRRNAARELAELGPRRGGALALQALGDPDDEVRLAAADAAIRLRTAGATDAVAPWLEAQDAKLRRKACEVARALPAPRVVAPLARTLGDPDPDVRAAAAEAMGHQSSPDAVPPLLGRLDDPTPAVRVQIVAALARLGDPRSVVPLVGKVQDSAPDVREAVVRALGDLGDPRASPALVLALRDQNNDVRRDALTALGRLRASDAVDAIAPFAADRAPAVRLAALGALGRIATRDALRALVQALGTNEDAAGSLGRTPVREALVAAGPAAVPLLHALLAGSPSPAAAAGAAWVLGEGHARGEVGAIVAAMRRGALPTAAALHALAGAGTAAEVPVVLEFVADPSPEVRDEAIGTATALLDPLHPDGRAVEPLAAALREARPSPAQRARMATLLGRTGAPRAAPLLVELTHANEPTLRLAAIDALGMLFGATEQAATDDALLEAMASPDAGVRLHAATALSEAGGPRARDALIAKLDGGDEVDRSAVLTALAGVMARAPSDAALARLSAALELAAGPERDAIVEAIGRAPSPAGVAALAAVARGAEPLDRMAAAVLLAAHPGDAQALATARSLLVDPDAGVRAQAAWTLGTLGDSADVAHLASLARGPDGDASSDATAAIGRIARRALAANHPDAAVAPVLCALAADPRPPVRANALAALALAGARCGDRSAERKALAEDPSEDVRAAAALVLQSAPTPDDTRALERCTRSDPSGSVAAHCRTRAVLPARTHPALVYVVPEGSSTPRPGAAYAMLLADGLVRAGTTDRRGAVFDPAAPEGDVTLRRPALR